MSAHVIGSRAKAKKAVQKVRHVCFTLNNPGDADYERLYTLCVDATRVRYAIVGLETAPSTGTQHFQGYISFTGTRSFNSIKGLIGERSHLEAAKGSAEQNQTYCRKEGDYEEFGVLPSPGKRSDLESAIALIKGNKRMAEVAEEYPVVFCRHFRGLGELQRILQSPQALSRERPTVRIYVGPSGTGKSRRALEEATNTGDVFEKCSATGKWWPRYTGQKCVIFNDFYGGIPYSELLVLLDRYSATVETKGGDQPFVSTEFWFTSNKHVRNWYSEEKFPNIDALYRRISVYEEMDALGQPGRDYSDFIPAINY